MVMAMIMISLIQLITIATLRSARHEVVNDAPAKHNHLSPSLDGSDCRGPEKVMLAKHTSSFLTNPFRWPMAPSKEKI